MAGRRVTLRDVASRLGLSVNTVSRAIAGKDQVSEETRAQVVAEAKRLGYRPNSHARSLVSGSTMVLGVVITNPSNPFYAGLISGIERSCRALGYSMLLVVTEEAETNETEAIEQLLRFGIDGIIGVPVQGRNLGWQQVAESGVPTVLVSRDLAEFGFDFVGIDAEAGIAEAVRHCAERAGPAGLQSAWLFEEDLGISTVASRVAGFRSAIASAGIAEEHSMVIKVPTRRVQQATLPWRADDAYRMAANLITAANAPDIVVTGNDYFALGVQRALRESAVTVPGDLQLVGYGDQPFAAYLTPALSTLALPVEEVSRTAVELLEARLTDPSLDRRTRLLSPRLQVRESTRTHG